MGKSYIRKNKLLYYWEDNRSTFIFTTVLLIMGVVFGSIIVNSMSFSQKNDLYAYLTLFFSEVEKGEFANARDIFTQSFAYYSKVLGFIWFLGLSIIGLPIVFILLFIKGLTIGFTVGFLVDQMGFEGFLFAFSSVFPQNIFLIPIFILVASTATSFSIKIWKQIVSRGHQPIFHQFVSYTMFILLVGGGLVIVSAFEALVTPVVMQFLVERAL
ncbi:stage II sporulation protein M [Salipaludibacillus daqingensis]|uniref:stage II sporulation protein M n=1 Tax=Salipaludibacillus daqingensis TaxID=3041001 RepID=UPI002475ADAB|nr:stage II sporulation protein M [Salipaludibacillus daqingensis]